jgi:hypothetical protein
MHGTNSKAGVYTFKYVFDFLGKELKCDKNPNAWVLAYKYAWFITHNLDYGKTLFKNTRFILENNDIIVNHLVSFVPFLLKNNINLFDFLSRKIGMQITQKDVELLEIFNGINYDHLLIILRSLGKQIKPTAVYITDNWMVVPFNKRV